MGVDLLNIKGLRELEHQGPIVMVNLMRFDERSLDGDGSGWAAYLRYRSLTVPMIQARGGPRLVRARLPKQLYRVPPCQDAPVRERWVLGLCFFVSWG